LDSLQGRYAVVAGLVAVVLLSAAYFSYLGLLDARRETTENIETRNQLLERSRLIRDAVWMTRESLAIFLIDPNAREQRQAISNSLRDARIQTEQLASHPWIIQRHHQPSINMLHSTLGELEEAIDELVQTRLDISRQYPALAMARTNMLPSHSEFYTAAALAIDELLEQDLSERDQRIYQAFVQARHLWTQMISNFRMYLANRLGSFDESVLPIQEKDVATHYQGLIGIVNKLQAMDEAGDLGFQGSISLEEIRVAAARWYDVFTEVKRIHQTDEWRADARIIRTTIEPRMEAAWRLLIALDKDIEYSANNDVSVLTEVAEQQTRSLWTFTALCILLIVAGYYALERTVLRPVASIARALKAESKDQEGTTLPEAGIQETRDLVSAFVTMREQVKARQVALEYHALHDGLTNLANRNRLTEHLRQAIKSANRERKTLALLMLDLDHFKDVNDTLGHSVGDQLLIEVGMRLSGLLRDTDTIARLGGDEFAILLPTANEIHAKKVATKVASALSHPFRLGEQMLYISASVGIALYPRDGLSAQTLIQHADIAMYQAKNNKAGWAVYDPDQDQHSVERLGLMTDLRDALSQNTLELYYQPKLALNDGRPQGVEALLRWQHAELGFISPEEIITLAEQTGLIQDIAYWVLETAVHQAQHWHQRGIPLSMAINLSAHNLQDDRIVEQVRKVLDETGFPAASLTLEITENAMMADPERAVQILDRLAGMGVHMAVDDFGTGFSSLGYLKRLPVQELKIDKSFVMDMTHDDNDAVIVRSTIDLAHNLGLRVVAEGVEDRETWDLLQILRCDTAQGFFMSRPIPTAECTDWLLAHLPELPPSEQAAG
jgi:diguanylate cyclase (GGDEF)-like protein